MVSVVQVTEMNLLASRHYAAEGRCFVLAVGALLHRRDLALADASVLPEDPDALLLDGGTTIIGNYTELVGCLMECRASHLLS